MLSVIMLDAIVLSVAAPSYHHHQSSTKILSQKSFEKVTFWKTIFELQPSAVFFQGVNA